MKCRCRIKWCWTESSYFHIYAESNDAELRVHTAIYINIWKWHCEKMGLDDPKLLSVCMSFDGWVCAICVLFFKGEQVLLFYNCVKWLLPSRAHQSINSCWGCNIWSNPKSYNRYYVHFCVPWILEVDSNDPHAGTTNDCICCFSWLSICVGTWSICKSWFSQGLVGCLTLPLHL